MKTKAKKLSELIPTNWLDPLLTGSTKVIGDHPYNPKDIERLLFALKQRIEKAEEQQPHLSISDSEIEKVSLQNFEYLTPESAFKMGAKWYRSQISPPKI